MGFAGSARTASTVLRSRKLEHPKRRLGQRRQNPYLRNISFKTYKKSSYLSSYRLCSSISGFWSLCLIMSNIVTGHWKVGEKATRTAGCGRRAAGCGGPRAGPRAARRGPRGVRSVDGCSPHHMLLQTGRYQVGRDGCFAHRMLLRNGRYQVGSDGCAPSHASRNRTLPGCSRDGCAIDASTNRT